MAEMPNPQDEDELSPLELARGDDPRRGRLRLLRTVAVVILLLLLLALWHWTDLGEAITAQRLAAWAVDLRNTPLAVPVVMGVYIIASVALFPLSVLVVATGLAFGPAAGFGYAYAGSLCGSAATYFTGYLLGHSSLDRLAGTWVHRVSKALSRRGFATMVTLSILPVAPFGVINMAAGASHIRFRAYLAGSAVGLAPGILVVVYLGARLGEFIRKPSVGEAIGTAVAAIVGGLILVGLGWYVRRRR